MNVLPSPLDMRATGIRHALELENVRKLHKTSEGKTKQKQICFHTFGN